MIMYLVEGAFSFLHILPIAAVCYTIVFMMIWLIGKRKPSVKLIPSYTMEFVLICYTCTILNITGLLNTNDGFFRILCFQIGRKRFIFLLKVHLFKWCC